VEKYVDISKKKTILQRQESKEKTGVFTGSFAKNPINNDSVPIFVCDYVLNDYANGMVMGVPSADKRDYDFAISKNIKIIPIIDGAQKCIINDGKHINSPLVNGLNINQACKVIND
jgi:leucyl-tRNA synthetase